MQRAGIARARGCGMIGVVQGDENTLGSVPSDESTSPRVLNYAGPAHLSRLVVVGSYHDLVEAHLACNALESAGITAILDGENLAATAKNYAPAISKLQVKVEEREAAPAREILDEIAQTRATRFRDIARVCPACRSVQVQRSSGRRMIGIAIVMLAVIGIVLFWALAPAFILFLVAAYVLATPEHAMHQCLACGHTWKPSALLSGSDDEEEDDSAEKSDNEDESREQEKAS